MATPRRNGRLPSCEPCRKSKLRCDHQSPICGRCLRNGRTERCVYHPAPLTQPRTRPLRIPSRRPKKQRPDNQVVFRLDGKVISPVDKRGTLVDQQVVRSMSTEEQTLQSGHLDLLSPKSTFREYEGLSQVGEPPCLPLDAAPGDRSQGRYGPDRVHLGSQLLSHLRYIHCYQEIIEVKNKISPGWFLGPPLSRALCESIKRMYDSAVRGSNDSLGPLTNLSHRIFGNTSEPIETLAELGVIEYFDMIAARWETVGLLFALLGTALFYIADNNPIFTHRNPSGIRKDELSRLCTAICGICCQFCSAAGTTTDAFCWFTTQHLVLLTAIFGDNDYRVWQKLGDLSTIVYALGLHQPKEDPDESSPFWLPEIRKRTMACAYAIDKQLATSLGRPPRISSRYCHLPLPLDITYDDILAKTTNENQQNLKTDAEGWNTEGKFTVGVKIRVALLASMLQENILELSFCPDIQSLSAHVDMLMEKPHNMQRSLPSFLRWSPENGTVHTSPSAQNEGPAFTHLEFTHQEFLLHRIPLKRLNITTTGLINSSLGVLGTLVDLINMRTVSGEEVVSTSKDLCQMGLPAAGIIASQLLSERSTQQSRGIHYPPLPANFRSVAIQKLSILVSHLISLVRPQDGNFDIAQKGAKHIRSVLDQILSTDESQERLHSAESDMHQDWDGECNFMNEADFIAWCDSIHWPQDSLLDFA
ncbi:putative chromatin structure remodeling complex protein RSC3 [Aspergillus stella-maris]|uniref:putative chromatin structure remodeling complex protein RSC3 n=1 Tax=Aspergillus stella-maris TaxID=1810926 RepID=UPI003CCE2A63